MKAYVVTGSGTADDNGVSKLTYKKIADGNGNSDVVPAGTAVLLQAAANYVSTEVQPVLRLPKADAYSGDNYLHGSDVLPLLL